MIIRNERFSTRDLNKEVDKLVGEIKTSDKEPKNPFSIKVGIRVNVLNPQSHAELAKELVEELSKNVDLKNTTFHITSESIVAPILGFQLDGKYLTSYYAGNEDLNPPDIVAWLAASISNGQRGGITILDRERQDDSN